MTATKRDLATSMADKLDDTQRDSIRYIEHIHDIIKEQLVAGSYIKLLHIGSLKMVEKSARPGRNPKQPDIDITIPARSRPIFSASPKLLERINGFEV